jgi:transcriptional regulator with XRE-family HTH domain
MPPIPYQAVFARNLARFREQRGLTQEELARLASSTGLRWLPVTVNAIERGRRKLSLGEAILLQHLLWVPLSDLAASEESVDVEGVVVDADVWRWLAPPAPPAEVRDWLTEGWATHVIGIDRGDRRFEEEARGEAERKAAQRLKVPGVELVRMAYSLWGRGLTDERNGRLTSTGGETRVRRGHVTRELLTELRQAFANQEEKRREGMRVIRESMTRSLSLDSVVIEEEEPTP